MEDDDDNLDAVEVEARNRRRYIEARALREQLFGRGDPAEIRAWLDSAPAGDRNANIGYLFSAMPAELVKAVVLRDGGVWLKEDMGWDGEDAITLVQESVRNSDPAVLGFVLGYRGYHVSQYDREHAILHAVDRQNIEALSQLLRDERFDPVFDRNAAVREAAIFVDFYGTRFGSRNDTARAREAVRLLLADRRVLRSFLPEPDQQTVELIRRRIGGARLLDNIRVAIDEDRRRRSEVALVAMQSLPRLIGGVVSGRTTRHIMEYADLTCATPGMCDECRRKRV